MNVVSLLVSEALSTFSLTVDYTLLIVALTKICLLSRQKKENLISAIIPESSSWMQSPTKGSSSSLWSQIGCQWGNGFSIVTRIIGKLDRDRFRGAFRNCSVQLLNGTLRFYSLVKSDKTDTFGESFTGKKK